MRREHGRRRVLSLEALELRTPKAADLELPAQFVSGIPCPELYTADYCASPLMTIPAGVAVDLDLKLTDLGGAPVSSVQPGDEFVLHLYAQDLRDQPHGVFAAFADITWDESRASVI